MRTRTRIRMRMRRETTRVEPSGEKRGNRAARDFGGSETKCAFTIAELSNNENKYLTKIVTRGDGPREASRFLPALDLSSFSSLSSAFRADASTSATATR